MEITDVLIVGGGPAGLGAAIYAKRAGLSVEVYESNVYGVGQITETDRVDNYLGLWGISGWDLAANFQNHAGEMGVTPKEGTVIGIRRVSVRTEAAESVWESALADTRNVQEDGEGSENESVSQELWENAGASTQEYWRTEFEDGTAVCSKTVIYAAGAKRRKLGAPGEAEFAGRGVSYCATCDGAFFRGQYVAVVGGGNAALDDALYLSGLCRRVYLIHRRNEFRGFQVTVDLIRKKENIEIRTPHQVTAITGDGKVGAVCLEDGTEIPVSGVFLAVGMQPATEVLRTCEAVKLDASGYIAAGEDCATSAPGFFAAGDVRTKNLRQIITAAADGANAAMSAAAYIQGM
ncbi:MAG: FAD-dependent oxidoreductase [Lachnospiraceae bacterium]|nr:FAD-dependent oxidoreductase [Lachnospiraceae bacterium]